MTEEHKCGGCGKRESESAPLIKAPGDATDASEGSLDGSAGWVYTCKKCEDIYRELCRGNRRDIAGKLEAGEALAIPPVVFNEELGINETYREHYARRGLI